MEKNWARLGSFGTVQPLSEAGMGKYPRTGVQGRRGALRAA